MCCVFGIDYIMYNVCVQNERFTKIMFLLDRVQNNSSYWNSQVKIPQNLQTWKVLTQILHLVIYPIHYTCTCRGNVIHVRTNFKPNCSKIFRCACTKTSDTYIVYILFLIQLYKYILEKYVTLDLSKPFRSKPAVFRCGVLPQLKG